MDASTIAEVLSLPEKHVDSVVRVLKGDQEKINQAVEQFMVSKSGPFKESKDAATDGWAESGKQRRPKKVRPARLLRQCGCNRPRLWRAEDLRAVS